jgi:hypothetical protein
MMKSLTFLMRKKGRAFGPALELMYSIWSNQSGLTKELIVGFVPTFTKMSPE